MDELENNQPTPVNEPTDNIATVEEKPNENIEKTEPTPSEENKFFQEESYYNDHSLPPVMPTNPQYYQQPYQTNYPYPQQQNYNPQQPNYNPYQQNYSQGYNQQQRPTPTNQPPVNNYQRPIQPQPIPQPQQNSGSVPPLSNIPINTTPSPRKDKPAMIIAIILVSLLVLSIIALGIIISIGSEDDSFGDLPSLDSSSVAETENSTPILNLPTNSKPDSSESKKSENGTYTPQEIYKLMCPAVVGITVYGERGALDEIGNASGIIISEDGYIITNAHVVEDAKSQKVTLSDDTEFVAKLIGFDVKTDLAVLKIEPGDYKLTVAPLGNSDELEIGEQVFAIGNPGGFTNSLTGGYVSGVNRDFLSPDGYNINCVQTDAALNPGNSGGPLINVYGQVVGVNAFGYVGYTGDYQNINFAIAINDAIPVVKDIINNGYVTGRIRIGIVFNELSPVTAEMYDVVPGLYIIEIAPDCDIANTELKAYDIITEINGVKVHDTASVDKALEGKKPGDTVKAKVYRKTITNEVTEFEISFKLMELNN